MTIDSKTWRTSEEVYAESENGTDGVHFREPNDEGEDGLTMAVQAVAEELQMIRKALATGVAVLHNIAEHLKSGSS